MFSWIRQVKRGLPQFLCCAWTIEAATKLKACLGCNHRSFGSLTQRLLRVFAKKSSLFCHKATTHVNFDAPDWTAPPEHHGLQF
jgi:hypothetical protein